MNKVKLNSVISVMGFQNEDLLIVLDKWDSEIHSFTKDIDNLEIVYDKIDDGSYVLLPCSYDIDDNSIIEDFLSLNNLSVKKSKKSFKELLKVNNLNDKWYAFRTERYKEIAIEWCENNDIQYK